MRESFFHTLFPAPRYLALPAAGFDISDCSIKYLDFSRRGGLLLPSRVGEHPIPEGLISSGVINDVAATQAVFKEVARKSQLRHVVVSLPEEKAFVFCLSLPGVTPREARESIELQIENYVPLPVTNIIFDYEVIQSTDSGTVVAVTALPKKVVADYAEAFSGTGLLPLAFELESQAMARSIVARGDHGTHLIVDCGRTRSGFTIVSDGIVRYTTTASIGGDLFTKSISEKQKIDSAAARQLKETKGLSRRKEDGDLFGILAPAVSLLRDEIEKHILYWNSHKDDAGLARSPIESVRLCGGDANVPGLVDYLSTGIETPITRANAWANLYTFDEYIPDMPFAKSLQYSTAIGLALRNHTHA